MSKRVKCPCLRLKYPYEDACPNWKTIIFCKIKYKDIFVTFTYVQSIKDQTYSFGIVYQTNWCCQVYHIFSLANKETVALSVTSEE